MRGLLIERNRIKNSVMLKKWGKVLDQKPSYLLGVTLKVTPSYALFFLK
jgi:hypothetical protein